MQQEVSPSKLTAPPGHRLEVTKHEVKLVGTMRGKVDGWFSFRGELVNVPFWAHVVLAVYDRRDFGAGELQAAIVERAAR